MMQRDRQQAERGGEDEGNAALPEDWRPGTAAAVLVRAFRNRLPAVRPCGASVQERLLCSIAGDYGTHALVLEALIEVLIRKGVMSEDEFEALLDDIDARDGQLDGTLGTPAYGAGTAGEGI